MKASITLSIDAKIVNAISELAKRENLKSSIIAERLFRLGLGSYGKQPQPTENTSSEKKDSPK